MGCPEAQKMQLHLPWCHAYCWPAPSSSSSSSTLKVRADLMGHLSAIKDYFLLAKGDFFHGFLVEARPLLALPPRPGFADAEVAAPFAHSATKSSAQHDRLFPLFRIRWAPEEVSAWMCVWGGGEGVVVQGAGR